MHKLFDKRDDLPFPIEMPYKSSNMPESIFYLVFSGEFLCISRSSMLTDDVIPSSHELVGCMVNQGAKMDRINRVLRMVIEKHTSVFAGFDLGCHELFQRINT